MTADQLRDLAERAAEDPSALDDLRAVEQVDGRPVDIGALLEGANAEQAAERAAVLADNLSPAQSAGGRPDPAADAAEILADERFTGTGFPRPFEAPLRWIGERLQPLTDWVTDRIRDLERIGGPALVWGLVAAGVLLAAWLLSRRVIRGRAAVAEAERRAALLRGEDPTTLDREADAAEAAGDWELAVRLRFRAGVLRLAARRVVEPGVSLTTGELARAVGSPEFAAVGDRFDAIVYGGAPAGAEDAEAVRAGWKAALG